MPDDRRCRDCARTLTGGEIGTCARCATATAASQVGAIDIAGPMVTGSGLVFLRGGHVCFEMANFGRLELPPDVAESLGLAFLRGARMLREGNPAEGTILLRGG